MKTPGYGVWSRASTRRRVSTLLILTLLLLSIYAVLSLTLSTSVADVSMAALLVVNGMFAVILSGVHLGTMVAVLSTHLVGRYLGTTLGALAVVYWLAQPTSIALVAITVGVTLIVVSWLPDRPAPAPFS